MTLVAAAKVGGAIFWGLPPSRVRLPNDPRSVGSAGAPSPGGLLDERQGSNALEE